MELQHSIAVIPYEDEGLEAIQACWQAVQQLQNQGLKVDGLLNKLDPQRGYLNDTLCAIADGREYVILQRLGESSTACRLDSVALAEASQVITQALDRGVDLVVFNKFGHAEAEGRGMINEFSRAVGESVPILTTVHQKYLEAWRSFSGELALEVAADAQALLAWAQQRQSK